jgi:filamentous hemagglutinin
VAGGIVDLTLGGIANKYPLAATAITESGSWIKNTTTFNDVRSQLNNAVQNKK